MGESEEKSIKRHHHGGATDALFRMELEALQSGAASLQKLGQKGLQKGEDSRKENDKYAAMKKRVEEDISGLHANANEVLPMLQKAHSHLVENEEKALQEATNALKSGEK